MHHSLRDPDDFDVRQAAAGDDATIAALVTSAYGPDSSPIPFSPPSVDDVRTFLRREDAGAFIAMRGRNAIGTVSYVVEGDVVQLFRLAVTREHRRRGVGAALISAVERSARERRAVVVYLQTPRASGLVEWYERLGYTIGGEEDDVVRGAVVIMVDLVKIL